MQSSCEAGNFSKEAHSAYPTYVAGMVPVLHKLRQLRKDWPVPDSRFCVHPIHKSHLSHPHSQRRHPTCRFPHVHLGNVSIRVGSRWHPVSNSTSQDVTLVPLGPIPRCFLLCQVISMYLTQRDMCSPLNAMDHGLLAKGGIIISDPEDGLSSSDSSPSQG